MRGTLHVVAADDVRWMLAVLGPVFAAGNKARHAQLGLSDDLKKRGLRSVRRILAEHGPLTRYELVERLGRVGIELNPRSQAPIHLIALAALHGICCLGPDRRKAEPTYVLLDDWVKPEPTPSRPLGELARRYFTAYGPAAAEDFAAWSGLRAAQARTAIEETLAHVDQVTYRDLTLLLPKGRRTKWRPPSPLPQDVRLLPAFDTYLLGYRSRDLAVDRSLQRRLQRGGGWLHPAVLMDGRAIAAWKWHRTGNKVLIVTEGPLASLNPIRRQLEAEADDIGAFLNAQIELQLR